MLQLDAAPGIRVGTRSLAPLVVHATGRLARDVARNVL
jgi:hypothetical protein